LVFTDPVQVNCQAPFASGAANGAACTGTLFPNVACKTGICSSSLGACTTRCAADADCGDPGFLCRSVFVNTTRMGFCARECTGDRSCLSGQICVVRDSATLDRIEKYCRPRPTASAPGTTTTDPSTCDHGQTVIVAAAQYCTAPCAVDADCPAAVAKCQNFAFLTPITNTTVQVGLCVRP